MIGSLFAHMEWADARVWRAAVDANATGDQTLREKLHHIHLTQQGFFVIWNGGELNLPWKPFADHAETIAWARGNYAEILPYVAGKSEAELDRIIDFPWPERIVREVGTPAPVTLRDTFVQLPCHSTYHRGQVNMRLRELGSEPPIVDYIAWIGLGRPTPAWP